MTLSDAPEYAKLKLLFGRRSVRSFQPKEVPNDQIRILLEAAMAAPSACCKDPWRFIVIKKRETLQKLSDNLPNASMLSHAGLCIVVCGEIASAHNGLIGYLVQDCSASIQNILLAGYGMDLGACWLGIYPRQDRMQLLSSMLHIPDGIIPVGGIAIGYPHDQPEPRTRFNKEFIHNEEW